ncbi:MAG: 2-oxoacid:acceptor oxidoreductase family protein [Chloroflexi bacterium]|nr:2-oxoacid:acceptor oxidoreductase family protein [Chloroflexota bacterium]
MAKTVAKASTHPHTLLPNTDSQGFYGIRLESIGGLGAHVAGQILAETGVLRMGLNGANFSSYGSEKKGSPVKAYIRFCAPEQDVRTSSPVDRPHVVAVFHEGLVRTEPVVSGLLPDGVIIVNSGHAADAVWEHLGRPSARLGIVDALAIAVEENSRVNTVMLGAVARATGFIKPEAVKDVIKATLGERYPQLLASNLRAFDRGFEGLALQDFRGAANSVPQRYVKPAPPFGYLDAPTGGVVVNPGNSVLKDLSVSRNGFLPAFHREKCVDCAVCDLVCPDFCFAWAKERKADGSEAIRLKGIDYKFCKGCMKCIDACPTLALTREREEEGYAEAHTVALFPRLEASRNGASRH